MTAPDLYLSRTANGDSRSVSDENTVLRTVLAVAELGSAV